MRHLLLMLALAGSVPAVAQQPEAGAEDTGEVLRMHLHAPLPKLDGVKRRPCTVGMMRKLEAFIHRCMDKDPDKRFQTPVEALTALRALVSSK